MVYKNCESCLSFSCNLIDIYLQALKFDWLLCFSKAVSLACKVTLYRCVHTEQEDFIPYSSWLPFTYGFVEKEDKCILLSLQFKFKQFLCSLSNFLKAPLYRNQLLLVKLIFLIIEDFFFQSVKDCPCFNIHMRETPSKLLYISFIKIRQFIG